MSVQVIIRSKKDPSYYIEQEFLNPGEINIGSDESNQIILEDPNNNVSRHHAQIIIDGNNYYLIDKGSEYGIYIQGNKVLSNTPIPIDDEIEFTMGEFKVALAIEGHNTHDTDESILIGNPFDEDMHALSSVFNRLIHRYQLEDKQKKGNFLAQAFGEMLDENDENEVFRILFQTMREKKHTQSDQLSQSSRELLEVLLEAVNILMNVNTQFQVEFLGESAESDGKLFNFDSISELREYLLHSDVTREESRERLNELHQELDTIIMHQIALVEGYRYGVQEGGYALLREVNPALIEKKVEESTGQTGLMKLPYKWIPSLLKSRILREIQRKYTQLKEKGKQYIEEKFFREPFIKQYQKSLHSGHRTEERVKMSGKGETVRKLGK